MTAPDHPSQSKPTIADAVRVLRAGGLVAFPTETVYGLGADALNPTAVARVFEVKGRPPTNPLIVHVRGPEMARSLVESWPKEAAALARVFWPGPLTIVLPRRSSVMPGIVTAGSPNVGLRSPDHPMALALLFDFDGPLVGPSANRSGYVSPTRAEHVRAEFPLDDVLVLDGGRGSARIGIESTVLSLAGDRPTILRPGVITPEHIRSVIGLAPELAVPSGPAESQSNHPHLDSPGRLSRHYAPHLPAACLEGSKLRRLLAADHPPTAVIARTLSPHEVAPPDLLLAIPGDPTEFAAALYERLREADASGRAQILIEDVPTNDGEEWLWLAIADRLQRATNPLTDPDREQA